MREAVDLARDIERARPSARVLLTARSALPERVTGDFLTEALPSDHPDTVAAFLGHWSPEALLWVWGDLRPNLVIQTAAHGCPMALVDAGQQGFDSSRDQWLPDMSRKLLSQFHAWFARSEDARMRLAQLGCPLGAIELVPPLRAIGRMQPFADMELADLRDALSSRPAWYARDVSVAELPLVLAAHRAVLRLAHRLLLVLEPASLDSLPRMETAMADYGLRHQLWGDGAMPRETCQVLVADTPGDAGLWHQIAPVTFFGQTLRRGGNCADPFDAAAHGSAILYGPRRSAHQPAFNRLSEAGAARMVTSETALAQEVSRLIAPDLAAEMAVAGWEVVTEGSQATHRVLELLEAKLGPDRQAAV